MCEWLVSIWRRIEQLPLWLFLAWVGVMMLLRNGLRGGGTEELLRFARDFPQPGSSYRSNAVVGPTIAWALGADSKNEWRALHLVFVLAFFVIAAVLLRRVVANHAQWRVALVWLSFCSIATTLLNNVGWYDVFTAIGAVLLAVGGSIPLAVIGGMLLGASNPEQGVAIILCAVALSWALRRIPASGEAPVVDTETARVANQEPADRSFGFLSPFIAAAVGLVAARIGILIWFAAVDADVQQRSDLFTTLLGDSLRNAAQLGSLGLYAWLGAGWIVVIWSVWIVRHDARGMLAATAGLVAIPAVATLVTLDGARVFAAVSSAALLTALHRFARESDKAGNEWIPAATAALMLFGLIVPAVATMFSGDVIAPWHFVISDLLGMG